MSRVVPETVRCPKCQRDSQVELHTSINVTLEPALEQQFLEGQLNRLECPCGASVPLGADLLFHDMHEGLLVQWAASHPPVQMQPRLRELDLGSFRSSTTGGPSTTRLVGSRNDLIEKVLILRLGLDDRVLELLKVMAAASARLAWMNEAPLFLAGSSADELAFEVWGQDGRRSFGVPREAYDGLFQTLSTHDLLPPLEPWSIVDRATGMALAEELEEAEGF